MQILIELFKSFILIGFGAYGGGLVTIPLIQRELVESRNWLGFNEMAQIIAVAQMTPGPIAINSATFTGFRISGIAGSLLATIGVVLPSLLILMLIAPWVDRFKGNRHLSRLSQGIQVGVLSLILFAVWSYGYSAIRSWLDLGLASAAFLFLVVSEKKLHPALVVLAGGIAGLVLF